jgi:UDP-N-acetylglucosamine 2-epimerase
MSKPGFVPMIAAPEEINRLITDRLSDLLFHPSQDADENLWHEGIQARIHQVGNVMIDTLVRLLPLPHHSQTIYPPLRSRHFIASTWMIFRGCARCWSHWPS